MLPWHGSNVKLFYFIGKRRTDQIFSIIFWNFKLLRSGIFMVDEDILIYKPDVCFTFWYLEFYLCFVGTGS